MGTYTVTYTVGSQRRGSRVTADSADSAALLIREARPDAVQIRVRDLTYTLRFGGK